MHFYPTGVFYGQVELSLKAIDRQISEEKLVAAETPYCLWIVALGVELKMVADVETKKLTGAVIVT